MKKFLSIISLAIASFLASCNPYNLLVSQSGDTARQIQAYQTCREAIKNMTFPAPCAVGDSARFAQALELIRNNRRNEAIPMLAELQMTTADTGLRTAAKTIRASFAIYDENWQEYLRLYANDAQILTNSVSKLVQGWTQGKPMSIDFSTNEALIPFTKNGAGSPMIEIVINGKKRTFLFDTGAQKTAITPELASELGIKPYELSSGGTVTGSTGKQVESKSATVESIALGGITARNVAVLVTDLTIVRIIGIPIVRFDGIIGWNIIKDLDCTLDYPKNALILRKPVQRTNTDLPKLFPYMNDPLVQFLTTENKQVLFEFDTGANSTSFTEEIRTKLPTNTEFTIQNRTTYGVGGGTTTVASLAKAFTLFLGTYRLDFTNIRSYQNDPTNLYLPDGRLGIDICQNKRTRFDATNGIFELE